MVFVCSWQRWRSRVLEKSLVKATLVIPALSLLSSLVSFFCVFKYTCRCFWEIPFPPSPHVMPLPPALSAVAQRSRLLLGNLLSTAGVFDAQISRAELQHWDRRSGIVGSKWVVALFVKSHCHLPLTLGYFLKWNMEYYSNPCIKATLEICSFEDNCFYVRNIKY